MHIYIYDKLNYVKKVPDFLLNLYVNLKSGDQFLGTYVYMVL
jgi:hypothetical protein